MAFKDEEFEGMFWPHGKYKIQATFEKQKKTDFDLRT